MKVGHQNVWSNHFIIIDLIYSRVPKFSFVYQIWLLARLWSEHFWDWYTSLGTPKMCMLWQIPHTTYNVNKSVVYSNFLEAIQSFVRQYNVLLLSFTYLDPVFLCWLKKNIYFFCLSQSFDLNIYPMFNRSTNVSTILIKFTLSTFFIILFYAFVSLLERLVWKPVQN